MRDDERKLTSNDGTDIDVAGEPKASVAEEPKTGAAEEPKASAIGSLKAGVAESLKASLAGGSRAGSSDSREDEVELAHAVHGAFNRVKLGNKAQKRILANVLAYQQELEGRGEAERDEVLDAADKVAQDIMAGAHDGSKYAARLAGGSAKVPGKSEARTAAKGRGAAHFADVARDADVVIANGAAVLGVAASEGHADVPVAESGAVEAAAPAKAGLTKSEARVAAEDAEAEVRAEDNAAKAETPAKGAAAKSEARVAADVAGAEVRTADGSAKAEAAGDGTRLIVHKAATHEAGGEDHARKTAAASAKGEGAAYGEATQGGAHELKSRDAKKAPTGDAAGEGSGSDREHTIVRLSDIRRRQRRRILIPLAAALLVVAGGVVAYNISTPKFAANSSVSKSAETVAESESKNLLATSPKESATDGPVAKDAATTDAAAERATGEAAAADAAAGDATATNAAAEATAADAAAPAEDAEALLAAEGEAAEAAPEAAPEENQDSDAEEEESYVDPYDAAASQVSSYTTVHMTSGDSLTTLVDEGNPEVAYEDSVGLFVGLAEATDANGNTVTCEIYRAGSWMEYPYAVRYDGEEGYWLADVQEITSGRSERGLTK